MTEPSTNGRTGGEKLRALENDRSAQRHAEQGDGLEGLREISRGWQENRSTEYLLRKAWADPINRWFFILVALGIAAIWAFLLTQ